MSGLFKRFSGRRSAGPEGSEPPTAAGHGTGDAPATPPAEPEGHRSLLTDPAAPTRVLREGEQPASDHTIFGIPAPVDARPAQSAPGPDPGDPAPAPLHGAAPAPVFGPVRVPDAPDAGPAPLHGPAPAPVYGPVRAPDAPAPLAAPAPPVEPVADLPAGLDPDELAAAPGTSARRGKLRRRIAFLRAARELLLRDLGGFVYELHRTAHDVEHEAHRRLRETKLARLSRVDAELHELEVRLDDVRRQVLVREPGVGGECPHCGELFASSAHYCSNCGNPLTESARRELAKAQAPAAEPAPVAEAAPVVAGPQPVPADQPTQEIGPLDPDHPSADAEFKWPSRGINLRKRRESEAAAPGTGAEAPVGETGADAVPAPAPPAGEGTPAAAVPGEGARSESGYGETRSVESPGEGASREVARAVEPGEGARSESGYGETPAAATPGEGASREAARPLESGEGARGETHAADPGENARGVTPAAAGPGEGAGGETRAVETPGEGAGGETPAAATPDQGAGGETPAAATPDEGAGRETPAAATPGDDAPAAATADDHTVTPVGDDAAAASAGDSPDGDRPAAASAGDSADDRRPAAAGVDDSADGPAHADSHHARNGTAPDDSILRPVERRQ